MASVLSVDLRELVVAAIEPGASRREATRRFEVSPASAVRWHWAFVQENRTHAKPTGGDHRSRTVEAQADLIRQTYKAQPELFLHELRERLAEHGLRGGSAARSVSSSATASRAKNIGYAAKQEQEDVKVARLSWFERQLDLDPDKLVFLDKTATNTKMLRRYGHAPRGKRCCVAMPFGYWSFITLTASLITSGLMASAIFDGPMTGARFRGYVDETLVLALWPG